MDRTQTALPTIQGWIKLWKRMKRSYDPKPDPYPPKWRGDLGVHKVLPIHFNLPLHCLLNSIILPKNSGFCTRNEGDILVLFATLTKLHLVEFSDVKANNENFKN